MQVFGAPVCLSAPVSKFGYFLLTGVLFALVFSAVFYHFFANLFTLSKELRDTSLMQEKAGRKVLPISCLFYFFRCQGCTHTRTHTLLKILHTFHRTRNRIIDVLSSPLPPRHRSFEFFSPFRFCHTHTRTCTEEPHVARFPEQLFEPDGSLQVP